MVVHLEHTPLASRAMVGAVRLLRLALLTVPYVARGCFHREGRVLHASSFLRR